MVTLSPLSDGGLRWTAETRRRPPSRKRTRLPNSAASPLFSLLTESAVGPVITLRRLSISLGAPIRNIVCVTIGLSLGIPLAPCLIRGCVAIWASLGPG